MRNSNNKNNNNNKTSNRKIWILALIPLVIAIFVKKRFDEYSQPCGNDNDDSSSSSSLLLIHKRARSGEIILREASLQPNEDKNHDSKQDYYLEMAPCQVFSESYVQARKRFRDLVRELQPRAVLHSLPISHDNDENDDNDSMGNDVTNNDLTIDIAVTPGSPYPSSGLVIHSSGTHGVEGYAGSAIQLAYLMQLQQQQQQQESPETKNKPTPTVVLIHAVNPWGMHTFRRTNAHNVDLNRNALSLAQWHDAVPHHQNHAAYQKFDRALFNPTTAPTTFTALVSTWYHAVVALARFGLPTLKAAMVGGQYYNPQGIFYGGREKKEAELQVLENWLTKFWYDFQKNKTLTHQDGRENDNINNNNNNNIQHHDAITWIDVHTGLGPMGKDTLLMETPIPNPKNDNKDTARTAEALAEEIRRFFPNSNSPYLDTALASSAASDNTNNDAAAAQVQQGYEGAMGFVVKYFHNLFTDMDSIHTSSSPRRPFMAVQEFGTVSNVLVAHALITENAARFHSHNTTTALEWARATTKRAFYPQQPEWRRSVLTRGLTLLHQAMHRSATLSSTTEIKE